MSIRNYNAWIKAARKASDKTGGLSLPAARKAYRKMAAHLERPLKGVDVKKHPIIFKRSIPVRSGGLSKKSVEPKREKVSRKVLPAKETRATPVAKRPLERKINSVEQFERLGALDFDLGEVEYVSTGEYREK